MHHHDRMREGRGIHPSPWLWLLSAWRGTNELVKSSAFTDPSCHPSTGRGKDRLLFGGGCGYGGALVAYFCFGSGTGEVDAIFLAPTARPIHPCRIEAERRGGFFRASHSRPSVPHICQRVEEENTLLFLSLFYFRLPTSPLPLSHGRHLARRGKNKAKKRSEGSEGGRG